MISVGPFDLAAPVGRGGMGEVWAGVHREQQVPVAIKVLTSEAAKKPAFHRAFRNEVRAVAGLDHPGIVVVYDHGLISAATEAASEGRLPMGSPYLAMERATGGTLHAACGAVEWGSLRLVLLALLDALAHAHARGVIHRDLKPGNVLLGGLRPGPRISDFGLAHAAGREAHRQGGGAGTPAYMAPEQFDASTREHGPWTDLYALGCLAWTMVTRSPPFGRLPVARMRAAHRSMALPPLQAAVPLADGFEDWLRTLLEKEPARRFRRAADAAHALRVLRAPESDDRPDAPDVPTPNLLDALGPDPYGESTFSWTAAEAGSDPDRVTPPDDPPGYFLLPAPPPQPADWRRAGPSSPSIQLLGAGLGLYGMRTVPFVGREQERDHLWQALQQTRDRGRAQVVLLTGPTGVGKSRLTAWLSERAQELGAADALIAQHAPDRGREDGLGGLLYRFLGLGGTRAANQARARAVLHRAGVHDPDEVAALHYLADPTADGQVGRRPIRFGHPEEPHALVRRLLEGLAADRPLILVLEDVQWGADAIAFTEHLLDAQEQRPTPVLVLLTATTDALADQRAEQALLGRLRAHSRVEERLIAPLDEDGRAALVRELLGLDGVLAAQLEERSGGNPLFLVQLVGDWVQRRLLVPSDRGFRLVPGAEVHLPDDIHDVWAARVARLTDGRPVESLQALELAAVLGREVNAAEWRAVCAEAGVPAPVELVDTLIEQRLACAIEDGPEDGWYFVHNMLRESIERVAADAGRLAGHHAACAAILEARQRQPGIAERLGRHLAGAGEAALALEPMLAGARERLDVGEHGAAGHLLTQRDRLISALGLPGDDPRRAEGWQLRCVAAMHRGELDSAEVIGVSALQMGGAPLDRGRLLLTLARIAKRKGDLPLAHRRVAEAAGIAEHVASPSLIVSCQQELAALRMAGGELPAAAEAFAVALAQAERVGDELLVARCHVGLASVAKQERRYADAVPHLTAARALFTKAGSRDGVAECANDLAEVDRYEGRLEAAEAGYREAVGRFRALGSGSQIIPAVNLGLTLLARGALSDADREFAAALPVLERQGRQPLIARVLVYRLHPLASAGDWTGFDAALARAQALLQGLAAVPPDVLRHAQSAAVAAEAAGQSDRAAAVRALAAPPS